MEDDENVNSVFSGENIPLEMHKVRIVQSYRYPRGIASMYSSWE